VNAEDKIEILQAIHEIHIDQVKMAGVLEENAKDIQEHIRRTNLLEKKVSKVFMFAIFSAGVVAARYSPEIIKILGVLL